MSNSSIWPIDSRVNVEVMAMQGYTTFLKSPALLEPHHQIVSCHKQDTRWEGVLPLCRDAANEFYNPCRLGYVISSVRKKK